MLRVMTDSLLPLLAAGTVMIFALCLAAMGIQRFFSRPVAWRGTWLILGLSFAGMSFFMFAYDSVPARITMPYQFATLKSGSVCFMVGTPAIRNLIREAKVAQMYSAIQTGQQYGMQTLDQNLQELVKRNVVSVEEARTKAMNKDNFK